MRTFALRSELEKVKVMAKKKKKFDGMVYSTNPGFRWDDDSDDSDEFENWSPVGCKLYVSLDRKQRAGKPVTFIEGHDGPASDLLSLGKDLKKLCGVGGSVKEGCILVQGDHRDKVFLHLEKLGYTVKRKGG